MAQAFLPSFPPFVIGDNPTAVASRWGEWLDRFENYLAAMDIKEATRKRAMLIHFAGEDVYKIFRTLDETGEPKDYGVAKAKLTEHFKPQQNIEYERYVFRRTHQQASETLDQYHTRLKQLASTCEFADVSAEIKSQIILNGNSSRLRRRALRDPKLTLKELLDLGRAMQTSEAHASGMERNQETGSVNNIRKSQHSQQSDTDQPRWRRNGSTNRNNELRKDQRKTTCFNCGGIFPHPKEKPCPAKGKTCRACNKQNHFAKHCKTTKRLQATSKNNVNNVLYKQSPQSDVSSSDDEYLFTVQQQPVNSTKEGSTDAQNKLPKTTVKFGTIEIRMLIDSGASVNIIDKTAYHILSRKIPSINLQPSKVKLTPYGCDTPIEVMGQFQTAVESKHKITNGTFYVVNKASGSLLSYETARELELIRVEDVNSVQSKQTTKQQDLPDNTDYSRGIGKLKDHQVKIHIDESVKPVAQRHRRIPFHMRKKVEAALDELEKKDIIEKTSGPTPWVSPIVVFPKPKNPNEVRICVDMRKANMAVQRERHLTPTVDEIINDLNGACVFSKLDLRSGYHQLELAPESRYITTFSTHKGLYRYKRLLFGLSSAAEVFQHTIQNVLNGIPNVKNISDDIIVFGKTQAEHDTALQAVLQRLRDNNLTLNEDKCEYNKTTIDFYGYSFSSKGISADPKKVESIQNASDPKSATELRSLLGLVNYVSRFIPDYSTVTAPLRELTKKNAKWVWSTRHQHALDEVKRRLISSSVMAYFDPNKQTEVVVDAGPEGLGAILAQKEPGTDQVKVVAYASRALSDTETRYSQTEKEALAIVWGCEKFHTYIYGTTFDMITDHKPLELIFNNPNSKPPARIERWGLRLQQYSFNVKYRPGSNNPADYMSRHPVYPTTTKQQRLTEQYVNFLTNHSVPKAINLEEIIEATNKDETLQTAKQLIQSGKWYDIKRTPIVGNLDDLKSLEKVRTELTVTSNGLILRGSRIVIPTTLQNRIITLAHEGHQGMSKTKSLLREKVWFPQIDKLVQRQLAQCIPCLAATPERNREPLSMSSLPTGPWEKVDIDFCGPMPTGEYLLVLIDEYSRFPIVEIIKSTSAKTTIPKLDKIFAEYGIPIELKSDNGPPFNSEDFTNFAKELGFRHRKITPYWPQANAEAERFMRTVQKAIRTAHTQGQNWKQELPKFLRNYRATQHSTTTVSPAELLFGRKLRTKLPQQNITVSPKDLEERVRVEDRSRKERMKKNADVTNHAKQRKITVGDNVLVKQKKCNKLTTPFDPKPYKVITVKGTMITAKRQDNVVTRNSSHFKIISEDILVNEQSDDDLADVVMDQTQPEQSGVLPQRRYPLRQRKAPDRLNL